MDVMGQYLRVELSPTVVKKLSIVESLDSRYKIYTGKFQGSNNGTTFYDITTLDFSLQYADSSFSEGYLYEFDINNNSAYLIYRIQGLTTKNSYTWFPREIQMYN